LANPSIANTANFLDDFSNVNTHHPRRVITSLILSTALVGCTVGPDYHRPDAPISERYDAGLPGAVVTAEQVELGRWWTLLGDPVLDSLVDRAINSNLDLELATARLAEARSQRDVAALGLLPAAAVSGGIARGTGNNVVRDKVDGPLNTAIDTRRVDQVTKSAGFDTTWEIDLFGRVRRSIEAGDATIESVTEDRRGVLVSVIADVARSYADLRTNQRRLDIAQKNVADYQRMVHLVEQRNRAGVANMLDVGLAQRQYQAAQAAILPLQSDIAESKRRLAVLLGLTPEQLYNELAQAAALPNPPPHINVGVPSDLLRRRPDIRSAERQLAAATARVGVATADFFPQVTLTGAFGWQSQGEGFSTPDPRFIYQLGPGVRWPILDFGKIDATVNVQDARMQQSVISYKRSVLLAVLEADNALSRYTAERDRYEKLAQAVTTAENVARLAEQRYERGLTDFLNVLDAQRQLYTLADQAAVAQQTMVTQWVALNKALGGGWEGIELTTPPAGRLEISPVLNLLPHTKTGEKKSTEATKDLDAIRD
jgi:NodT family efflux transporter outer membrane factor (OMF) lipoprotein